MATSVVCGFLAKDDAFALNDTDNHRHTIYVISWVVFSISAFFGLVSAGAGYKKNVFICDKSVTADVFLRHMVLALFCLFMTIPAWTENLKASVYLPTGYAADGTTMQLVESSKYQMIAAPALMIAFWVDAALTVQKGLASMIDNVLNGNVKNVLSQSGKFVSGEP